MAKRRLSQQQKQRIEAAQSAYRHSDSHQQGLVVSHQGGRILVELEPGILIDCKIKSNLGSIVCGDKVAIEAGTNQQHRVMAKIGRAHV
jgi:ribosome biogenesis GTPase